MSADERPRSLSLRQRKRLVDALISITELRDETVYLRFVQLVGAELDATLSSPPTDGGARYRLDSLIVDCYRLAPADVPVVDVLLLVAEHLFGATHVGVVQLREANGDLTQTRDQSVRASLDDVLEPEERTALRRILSTVKKSLGPADVASVLDVAFASVVPVTVAQTHDLPTLTRRLEAMPFSHGAPPLLVFLAHLTRYLEDPDPLREWLVDVADRLEVDPSLLDPPSSSQPRDRAYLMVRADEDDCRPGRYRLAAWWRWDGGGVTPKHELDKLCSGKELRLVGRSLLEQAAPMLTDPRGVKLSVEFLLPWSLLDHPVEGWTVGAPTGSPVGWLHPVVVRSSDRLSDLETLARPSWHQRWAIATGGGTSRPAANWIVRGQPADGSADPEVIVEPADWRQLLAQLLRRKTLACVGLMYPYEAHLPASVSALQATVKAGIPVVLWSRNGRYVDTLRALVRTACADGRLTDLPAAVHDLRLEAAEDEPDDNPVALLWDDPDRLPEHPSPLTAPQSRRGPGG
ncbi:hypothetical protein GCM10009557_07240 [Virgisporangium ochraceum]|uniref:Uncharacterized protein n=1 Tax=Virgisporangium ochraceum TaxID=65505 RepID=A0A8J4EH23_9ACTN|nr:hypothetical protein [Virgisporangium ochraceum]GIJ74529.1 hypothetical protein Voc01_094460 [Virgisporangium ochraceum]